MKLQGKAIEGFIARPDPKIRAVLVYGPDAGLVRDRADTLARSVVADRRQCLARHSVRGDHAAGRAADDFTFAV